MASSARSVRCLRLVVAWVTVLDARGRVLSWTVGGYHRYRAYGCASPASAAAEVSAVHHLASTAQRAGEPAWHRRQRRHRANARTLLRIASANQVLRLHHSAMPNGQANGKGGKAGGGGGGKGPGKHGAERGEFMWRSGEQRPGDWDCIVCGLGNNRSWRPRCRGCEALRKRDAAGCGTGQNRAPPATPRPQTTAERQLQRQKNEQQEQRRRQLAANRELAAQVERLEEELAAARKGGRERKQEGDENGGEEQEGDDMDTADGYSTWTEEERQRRLEQARASLPYLVSKHGEESPEARETREEIDAIQKASREAKPFKAHRDQLERRREKLRKQQSRDEEELARIKAERDELQDKITETTKAIEDRAKLLGKVDDELTELVKRSLLENGALGQEASPNQAPTAATAMAKALESLRSMEGKPGMPPEFSAMLAQFQGIASTMVAAVEAAAPLQAPPRPQPTAPSSTSPSPQQHADAGSSKGTDGDKGSRAGGGKEISVEAAPTILAPHGRWNKPAGAAAAAGDDGSTTVAAGGAQAADDDMGVGHDQDELQEEEALDPAIDEEVVRSINKLPTADQRRLRAALGARGGRRGNSGDDEAGGTSGNRDRERSPRPTKNAGASEEL